MKKIDQEFTKKVEAYLESIPEGVNLSIAVDYPPSRIRAILVKVFVDYFKKNIDERVLIESGCILHSLQFGTWDADPDIMTITCEMSDYLFEDPPAKETREKNYQKWFKDLSENRTVSVSLPLEIIEKYKKDTIQETIKKRIK